MRRKTILSLCAILPLAALLAISPGPPLEKVVLRTAGGRFLGAGEDGALCAESFLPGDKETFALVSRGKQEIALKAADGRWLVPDVHDGRTPCLASAAAKPGDRETFQLVPAGENRVALRGEDRSPCWPSIRPAAPTAREPLEIYRVRELPTILQTAVPAALHALAREELAGKQYDKTQTHKTEKYLDLPDPTLKDPKRKKRHKVISVTEEFRVQAQLDGEADIRLPAMLLLASRVEGGAGVILLAVDARLPVRGHVQYKLPDVASASTGYRAEIQLSAVAEVRVHRSGGDITFSPPAVLDLHVSFSRLDLSNDLLKAVRREVKDVVNHELRRERGADSPAGQPCVAKGDVLARRADTAARISASALSHCALRVPPALLLRTDRLQRKGILRLVELFKGLANGDLTPRGRSQAAIMAFVIRSDEDRGRRTRASRLLRNRGRGQGDCLRRTMRLGGKVQFPADAAVVRV